MAAPAPHHYAKACGPLVITDIQTPDPAKPRNYRLVCQLQLLDSGETYPVHCHYFSTTPPMPNEMVEFRGSIAHDGSMGAPIDIFVNKVEQFPWADPKGELIGLALRA